MVARVELRADVLDAAQACLCAPLPRGDAQRVRVAARRSSAIGEELRHIARTLLVTSGTSMWSGAAFTAFSDSIGSKAPRLSATADRYDTYAKALSSYADSLSVASFDLPRLAREIAWRSDELRMLRASCAATSVASLQMRNLLSAEEELHGWVRRFQDLHGQWVDAVVAATRAIEAANAHDPTRDLHGWNAFTHKVDEVVSLKHLSTLCDELSTGLTVLGVGLLFVFPPAGMACLTAATVISAVKFGTDVTRSISGDHLGLGVLAMSAVAMVPGGKGLRLGDEVIEIGTRLERGVPHRIPGGSLLRHEGVEGGHTLCEHVRPRSYMRRRLAKDPEVIVSSVFMDLNTAETAIGEVLVQQSTRIENWLGGSAPGLVLKARADVQLGWVLKRGQAVEVPGYAAQVVLRRSEEFPSGYRIHTAYVRK